MVVFGTQSVSLDLGPRVESEDQESDGEGVWSFVCGSPVVPIYCPGIITDITPFHFPKCPHWHEFLNHPRCRRRLPGAPKMIPYSRRKKSS